MQLDMTAILGVHVIAPTTLMGPVDSTGCSGDDPLFVGLIPAEKQRNHRIVPVTHGGHENHD